MKRCDVSGGLTACAVVAVLSLGACSEAATEARPGGQLGPSAGNGAPAPASNGGALPSANAPGGAAPDAMLPGSNVQPGHTPSANLGTAIPCDVAQVVASNCHQCHGPNPVGGAMKLVSHEDWHRTSPIYGPDKLGDPDIKVYEVAQLRINDGSMPQGATMAADALATLDAWLLAGATAGGAEDAACEITVPGGNTPGGALDPNDPRAGSECTGEGAYDALVARDQETCYDFRVHGVSSPTDTSKFPVAPGESYHEFIYDVPWTPGTIATRFGADFDNLQVLHHWLAFDYTTTLPAGTVSQNVTGTTLGSNANLIGGWAVGGCNVEFPDNMGLQLPDAGKIMVQWHVYNTTGMPQPDSTAVQFCTVPRSAKPNVGGLTWLGTENFNGILGMGAGMNEFGGTCINDSAGPITIVAFLPHLHTIGINMRSEVQRGGTGAWETVFDQPFDFNWQVHYNMDPPIVLQPNDRIKSTCTFFNDTGANVAFGQSTEQEMCYQFAFSYPAGALDNGVLSLIGATNTCWQLGE